MKTEVRDRKSDPGSARASRVGRGASPRSSSSVIQRKLDNVGARSHLDEAIGSIRRANACWPFRYVTGLIESLQQLQRKIKAEIRDTRSEVRDSAPHPASRISDPASR